MNALMALNKWLGILFAGGLACAALYIGLDRYTHARKTMHKRAEGYLQQMVEDSMYELPPGLNGEYPADGPMADFYRQNPTIDGTYIPVAPR